MKQQRNTNLAGRVFDESISPRFACLRAGLVKEVVEFGYLAVLAEELDEGIFVKALCEIAHE